MSKFLCIKTKQLLCDEILSDILLYYYIRYNCGKIVKKKIPHNTFNIFIFIALGNDLKSEEMTLPNIYRQKQEIKKRLNYDTHKVKIDFFSKHKIQDTRHQIPSNPSASYIIKKRKKKTVNFHCIGITK